MKIKTIGTTVVVLSLMASLNCIGCGNSATERFFKTGQGRFLSPDKPILAPDEAQVSWIIQSLGELDKTDELYPNATRPSPQDWIYADQDYRIGPTDVLGISIQDLYYEGVETTLQREVSNSGYVDLPLLPERIQAEGMTATQLTDAIEKAYYPAIIKDAPIVTVMIMVRRRQMFSILGSVLRPGTYNLARPDMRLLGALALSGGVAQPNIDYIYVLRSEPPLRQSEQPTPAAPSAPPPPRSEQPAPSRPVHPPEGKEGQLKDIDDLIPDSAVATTDREAQNDAAWMRFADVSDGPSAAPSTAPAPPTTRRWVYRNGQWEQEEVSAPTPAPAVPATPRPPAQSHPAPATPRREPARPIPAPRQAAPRQSQPPAQRKEPESPEDPFGWTKAEKQDMVRVIAVNLKKLEQGDYRMNIVIRENDIIQVPSLEIGEFFVMGEVLRPGAYSLTGRKVTIKMALASAGNLGPLAWPENSVLIRRIGKNQEQMIPVDIESILRGSEPDIYLKPNDILAVGTSWSSSFLAVMRNAFRMTYGFGFIYDRNFADPLTIYPNSKRFKGW